MNIRRSFFLDCSPCVISNDKAGPTMKAETNYNTDYSKNALFEKRAKLYSRHSRILELSPLSKGRGRGDWFGSFKSEMNDNYMQRRLAVHFLGFRKRSIFQSYSQLVRTNDYCYVQGAEKRGRVTPSWARCLPSIPCGR